LEVKVRERNNMVIFDIINKEIILDGDSLLEHVKEQLNKGKRNLLLNYNEVDFIDSFIVGEMLVSFISTQNGEVRLSSYYRPRCDSV
jgi:anti-anti-sigma regulatory factor